MASAYFIIPGNPQGKARARTFYNSKLGRTQSITPEKTVIYENLVKQMFIEHTGEARWFDKEPLSMWIKAFYPIPKSTSKKNRQLMIDGKILPTKKPDADNVAKVICDALNDVAYGDDTQIVKLTILKAYSAEPPRVEVLIENLELGGD